MPAGRPGAPAPGRTWVPRWYSDEGEGETVGRGPAGRGPVSAVAWPGAVASTPAAHRAEQRTATRETAG